MSFEKPNGKWYSELDTERKKMVDEILSTYSTPWWNSDDPKIAAMYQVFEERLFIDIDFFKEGLSTILGRTINTHDLISDGLKDEVTRIVLQGKERTKEEAQDVSISNLKSFEAFCLANNISCKSIKLNQE